MSRFSIGLLGVILVCAARTTAQTPAQTGPPGRPNVVVIMVDDLDCNTLKTLLKNGEMPNLQRWFLANGVRFDSAYVTTALCAPSRASFLTGQYSHNHGIVNNHFSRAEAATVEDFDANSLPAWLQSAGYRTALVGKYPNGFSQGTTPPECWDAWHALVEPTVYNYWDYVIQHQDDSFTRYREYQTHVLSRLACETIGDFTTAGTTTPFFLYVTPVAPHTGSGAPPVAVMTEVGDDRIGDRHWKSKTPVCPEHLGDTADPRFDRPDKPSYNEPRQWDQPLLVRCLPRLDPTDEADLDAQWHSRLEAMMCVDDLIGDVFDALQAQGVLDRTRVVFTSDNGFFSGEHRMSGKILAYEEAIRTPLFLHLPGVTPASRVIDRCVVNLDLTATIVDWAGATPGRELDGRSWAPLLADPHGPWRYRFLAEFVKPGTVSIDTTKDLRLDDTAPIWFAAARSTPQSTVAPNSLYDEWLVGDREFYRMEDDPFQIRNCCFATERTGPTLCDSCPYEEEMSLLSEWLERMRTAKGEECRRLEDVQFRD